MQPSAKIIADSISEQGHRITTMEVVMHRFVLAEFNTHRVFSRNSASSRAIPVEKIIERVITNPAYPVHWGGEQKGMQSGESLSPEAQEACRVQWDNALLDTLGRVKNLRRQGLHKSLINRLLEPFMWHTAIVTATEWANFFNQRCDLLAQPEMKAVADKMQLAYYTSKPKELAHGQWHTPYIDDEDIRAIDTFNIENCVGTASWMTSMEFRKQVSVARCARVSYLTHDGKRDIGVDLGLYDKLKGAGHWSPFEHVATPVIPRREGQVEVWDHLSNFRGWMQFRKQFPNENRVSFSPTLDELQEEQGYDPTQYQP